MEYLSSVTHILERMIALQEYILIIKLVAPVASFSIGFAKLALLIVGLSSRPRATQELHTFFIFFGATSTVAGAWLSTVIFLRI